MKKTFIAICIALSLTACKHEAQSVTREGIDFKVEFLFEKDGVKMYRFYDMGNYHYYTNRGETISKQSSGKSSRPENIN